jgi:hypothetical protein
LVDQRTSFAGNKDRAGSLGLSESPEKQMQHAGGPKNVGLKSNIEIMRFREIVLAGSRERAQTYCRNSRVSTKRIAKLVQQ